ncbi:hypothetical protein Thena_1799 [Thermodesulfobium narugense DSM 14796]|uniref:Uncharacterized protein n=1 Tax=Thermodesulfobium narugense DSM 14796 TaxID=747365 RepID=M1E978_9BACT|nr:hypothetical protein [Thermodesulfobium narugense]AEE15405.1 hypothetical protein Thena_1799 [Thermodesulfobium narugense DSM 14796]
MRLKILLIVFLVFYTLVPKANAGPIDGKKAVILPYLAETTFLDEDPGYSESQIRAFDNTLPGYSLKYVDADDVKLFEKKFKGINKEFIMSCAYFALGSVKNDDIVVLPIIHLVDIVSLPNLIFDKYEINIWLEIRIYNAKTGDLIYGVAQRNIKTFNSGPVKYLPGGFPQRIREIEYLQYLHSEIKTALKPFLSGVRILNAPYYPLEKKTSGVVPSIIVFPPQAKNGIYLASYEEIPFPMKMFVDSLKKYKSDVMLLSFQDVAAFNPVNMTTDSRAFIADKMGFKPEETLFLVTTISHVPNFPQPLLLPQPIASSPGAILDLLSLPSFGGSWWVGRFLSLSPKKKILMNVDFKLIDVEGRTVWSDEIKKEISFHLHQNETWVTRKQILFEEGKVLSDLVPEVWPDINNAINNWATE